MNRGNQVIKLKTRSDVLMRLATSVIIVLSAFVMAHADDPVTQRSPVDLDASVALDPILLRAEQQRIEAVARAIPATVSVFVPGGAGGGSGVLISPEGYALTNFHVTSPAGSYMRCGLSDGNVYDAVIVGVDPVGDLAMIRLLGRDDFPAAQMGDSRRAQPGDWVMVIGNPFLLATNLQPTVTWGILSGVGRYQYPSGTLLEYGDCLQTDASVNPGNSGGPIFDDQGRLLGIVGRCSFEKRGRVNVGVGYAISINQAKNFLGYLRSGRIVDHATLGATVATDPDGGVVVSNILESSDAYRRGLRYGAEILEIDGRVVQTANDVQNILATFPAQWRVKLSYRLEGNTVDTVVRLASVHHPDELLEKMAASLPPPPPKPMAPPEGTPKNSDPDGHDHPDGRDHPEGHPLPGGHPVTVPKKIPKHVAEQLIERRGFANYYFNLVQQDRFIDALRRQFPADQFPADRWPARSDSSDSEASDSEASVSEASQPDGGGQVSAADLNALAWMIEAETIEESPQKAMIRIGPDKLSMVVGDRAVETESRTELFDRVSSQSMAGMLAALDAWRRMLIQGPQQFGDSYYLGSMPLGGERPLRDCMVGIDGELETRWLYHPETELIESIEVFADRDRDPAELWLIREGADTGKPTILELRYGTLNLLRLRVKSWQQVTSEKLKPARADSAAVDAVLRDAALPDATTGYATPSLSNQVDVEHQVVKPQVVKHQVSIHEANT